MELFANTMKYLPKNLRKLNLTLHLNKLGGNVENMKYLQFIMMDLPINLHTFELGLDSNNLGEN